MLGILLSLQFVGIAATTVLLSIALAFACSLVQKQLLYITSGEWLMEHIYCPVSKVLLLMLMAYLLFPLIYNSIGYIDLLKLFIKKDFLLNMVNILFVASLVTAFIPLLNHPAIAMPLLGCIAIGLIYNHQVSIPAGLEIAVLPSAGDTVKILVLMIFSYLICRWLTLNLSQWLDYHFNVLGSKALVSDSSHLILQMPVMLAYGDSLQIHA